VLFAVIGGLLLFWWFRHPELPQVQRGGSEIDTPDLSVELAQLPATAEPPQSPTLSPPTVTPTATASPVPAGPVRHTVEAGDTVISIAAKYGATAKDIISANGLSADGFLRIGQELLIPVPGPSGGAGPTATPKGGTLIYTVEAGDTISLIADRFGSTMEWIFSANNMKPTDVLHVGQSLMIPLSNVTPTPAPTVLASPAPTPTPGLPFRAPILLAPGDRAAVGGANEILLSWTSAGVLAKDQWYVVTLRTPEVQSTITPFWTKGTSWRVPRDFRPEGDSPVEFTWQVQVLTGSPGNPGKPASPPSDLHSFTWE
jgi:LysM repeat protein